MPVMKRQSNVHATAAWICRASPADPMWLLPAASRRESRWKNGGGRTFEVASDPPGSTPDGFNWRVSIAEIAEPGPFSSFAGVDRTLSLVQGGPLTLCVGEEERLLTSPLEEVSFAGDCPVMAWVRSPAWVLNTMSCRASHRHQVRKVRHRENIQPAAEEILVLISLNNGLRVGETSLGQFDAAMLGEADAASLEVDDEGSGLLVSIRRSPKTCS